MMRKLMIALCAMALIATSAGAQEQNKIELNVGDFTTLHVNNSINVVYRASEEKAGTAVFHAPNSMANIFIFNNDSKGKLSIQLTDYNFNKNVPTITVYSSSLQEVVNQSDSTVTIDTIPQMPVFKAKTSNNGTIIIHGLNTLTTVLKEATGNGKIYADGTTEKLECKLVGTGLICALRLQAHDISCTMGGSGHIYCQSEGGYLKVKGFGSGKVHYTGTPSEVKVKKLGTLKALPYTPDSTSVALCPRQ